MIIIIDGYNVIKQALGAAHISHAQRHQFVAELVNYLRRKKLGGVIVFDGGEYSYPHSTRQGDVEIIFSGYKEKADALIMRFVDEHAGQDVLVVSSDREIRNHAHAHGKETLGADDFYYRYVKKVDQKPRTIATDLHKLAVDAPQELDELMREASATIEKKEEDAGVERVHRQRSAQQTSKKERKQQRVLKKL